VDNNDIDSIFEQINNLKTEFDSSTGIVKNTRNDFKELITDIATEIQRVLDKNDFTQDDLCKITNMSQSNVSKILNGRVVPKIETLHKIALATNTKLVVSFENIEGDN